MCKLVLCIIIIPTNVAVCRSYLSAATKYSERTKAVSMISLAQVLGFMVGPAIQAAVVPLGDKGVWLIPNKLKLNMYTAPGWINVFLTIINIYLFFPNVFHERKIAAREVMVKEGKESEKATWKGVKPDYFAAWTYIIMFFVIVFNFMLMETLGTPLIMDQLGWSKDDALFYMGVLLSVCALCSIVTFPLIPVLSRKFSEVKLLIWVGFFLVFIGRMLCIPFYGPTPLVYDVNLRLNLSRFCDQQMKNITLRDQLNYHQLNESLHKLGSYLDPDITNEMEVRQMTFDCGDDLLGCPSNQEWCNYVPAITFAQFILCFILTVIGYPIGVTLIQTLFSKLLGSRPQGVWMGLMTGAGCLSRIMGPVFVTYIYQTYGTIWTFGLTAIMMVVGLLWLLYFRRRLEPHDPYEGTQEMKDLVSINDGQKELLS
ncbi:hypothetical protein ABEB36_012286 [Hypothenemus hampei]|uniref:Major facilitator superfamily domain-containing protein 8 n=1 Tax=Hypothenemus hampei TaxID=57062 RepID=A0ABD1ECP9_HYPHA